MNSKRSYRRLCLGRFVLRVVESVDNGRRAHARVCVYIIPRCRIFCRYRSPARSTYFNGETIEENPSSSSPTGVTGRAAPTRETPIKHAVVSRVPSSCSGRCLSVRRSWRALVVCPPRGIRPRGQRNGARVYNNYRRTIFFFGLLKTPYACASIKLFTHVTTTALLLCRSYIYIYLHTTAAGGIVI